MIIWLVRKGYNAVQFRRARGRGAVGAVADDSGAGQVADVSPAGTNVDPATRAALKVERRALLIARARLMVALAIPVFLETLDYTSMSSSQCDGICQLDVDYSFESLLLFNPTSLYVVPPNGTSSTHAQLAYKSAFNRLDLQRYE